LYQALYRKWRPKTFDEVDGQEHITEILKKQVLLGRLSHAYLFTGTRGTGKTTCAKLLARAVNCENPAGGNPCGKCPACVGIENGSILDVTEIDAASNSGVENVRSLREEAVYMPVAVRRRGYIIDEVHMLSYSAFNALLKILEEPPEHLIFILATTELHRVPPTILSRCQRYSFKRIPPELISRRLTRVAEAEDMRLTEEAAALLSRLADGSLRDALSLLDQCSGDVVDRERVLSVAGTAENDEICAMFASVLRGDAGEAIDRLNRLYQGGKDVASVLNQLASLHRDLLLNKIAPKTGGGVMSGNFSAASLRELECLADTGRLLAGLEELQETGARLAKSGDRKLAAELCLLRLGGLGREGAVPARKDMDAASRSQAGEVRFGLEKEAEREVPRAAAGPEAVPAEKVGSHSGPGWKVLLAALKARLPETEHKILSDAEHASAELSGGLVRILAKSDFSYGLLNNPQLINTVRETAAELSGKAVGVQIEQRKQG